MPNNSLQLKCGRKIIYRTPKSVNPKEPAVPVTPGLGIHEHCCRCKCECKVECVEEAVNDPFDGSAGSSPDSPPWTIDSGSWQQLGDSHVRNMSPGVGQMHVTPGGTFGDQLTITTRGETSSEPHNTPGTIFSGGIYAIGTAGSYDFTLDFYVIYDSASYRIIFDIDIDVPPAAGTGEYHKEVEWEKQPNFDLQVFLQFIEKEYSAGRFDLRICAVSAGEGIVDGIELLDVTDTPTFGSLQAGLKSDIQVDGTKFVKFDSFLLCGKEVEGCTECPGAPAVITINADSPQPTDGRCDACDPKLVLEDLTLAEPLENCRWTGGSRVTADPLYVCEYNYTLPCKAITSFQLETVPTGNGDNIWWKLTALLDLLDSNLNCLDVGGYVAIYWSDELTPSQCSQFPITLGTRTQADSILGICATDWPPSYTLTLPAFGFLSTVPKSIMQIRPGSYLYSLLLKLKLLNPSTCKCKGDFGWLNSQPKEFWEREDKQKWLEDRLVLEAKRRFGKADVPLIRRILNVVRRKIESRK